MTRRIMNAVSSFFWMYTLFSLGMFLRTADKPAVFFVTAAVCSILAGCYWNGSKEN